MALIRWEPARELNTIQTEMDRSSTRSSTRRRQDPRGSRAAGCRRWIWSTTDSDYVLRADLPGLTEEDVNIELQDNVLTVSGERKSEHEDRKEGYYRVERSSGSFSRSLTLPEGVDADAITASFDKGVLEVRIPKPEERKPRKVAITVGEPAEDGRGLRGDSQS